jgi:hypothetical protein
MVLPGPQLTTLPPHHTRLITHGEADTVWSSQDAQPHTVCPIGTKTAVAPPGRSTLGGIGGDRRLLPRLIGESEDRRSKARNPTLAPRQWGRPGHGRVVRGQGDQADFEASGVRLAVKAHLCRDVQDGGCLEAGPCLPPSARWREPASEWCERRVRVVAVTQQMAFRR